MQQNQGNPICGFLKNVENFRFWAFLTILAQNGQFWTDAAQNVQFSSFPAKKQKLHFFTLPKTSIHGKNQGNPMCGYLEKQLHDIQRDRDETVFNGPNCPVGVGPKIVKIQI